MKSAFALLACAALASAQSLSTVLMGNMTSELVSLIKMVPGLMDQLEMAKDVTILAPTNKAIMKFAKDNKMAAMDPDMVSGMLMYHVLKGTIKSEDIMMSKEAMFPHSMLTNMTWSQVSDGQYVMAESKKNNTVTFTSGMMKESKVVMPNMIFDGGVIHMIDKVLAVPMNVSATAMKGKMTGVTDALMKANLVDKLQSMSNMTIFAPSNKAFEAIKTVMGNASTDMLTNVLEYHVVQNNVMFSTDLMNGSMLKTANGAMLTVHQQGDKWFVNDAMITMPNMLVSNGVIHVVDNVLNPENTAAMPSAMATAGNIQFESGAKETGASENGAKETGASETGAAMAMTTEMPESAETGTSMIPTMTGMTSGMMNGSMTRTSVTPEKATGAAAVHRPLSYMGALAVGAAVFL